ncbi:MAG: putative Trimethylamine corrinoid protein 1 [Promethearchaeota archaeon]|nr:MAG: putative Trimethylamine corrinoid protein 1 [Candidatus Lokiarchaeota archaeon]
MDLVEFKSQFYQNTLNRNYNEAIALVEKGLKEGIPPEDLITEGIADTLNRFQNFTDKGYEKVSAFQLLAVGKIAEDSMEKIRPQLEKRAGEQEEKIIVLGTIQSDFHALGKRILKLFLEVNNFKVIDLGLDVSPDQFVEAVKKYNADYLFISTMMLHNIIGIKRVGDLLIQKNLRSKVKFFVGGAPFNYNYGLVKKVNADDSAENIHELIEKLTGKLTEKRSRWKKVIRFFKRGE